MEYQAHENANEGWLLGAQILETLGGECEVDASFFEDSWTYGLPAVLQQRRVKASPAHESGFAELDTVNAWVWMETLSGREAPLQVPVGDGIAKGYASWHEQMPSQADVQGCVVEQRDAARVTNEFSDQATAAGGLTLEDACQLLRMSAGAGEGQVKATYRKLVTQWHPDLFSSGNEAERAKANERMAVVNQTYQVLRGLGAGATV